MARLAPLLLLLALAAIPASPAAARELDAPGPRLSFAEARELLYPAEEKVPMPAACAAPRPADALDERATAAAIRCLITEKYRADRKARDLALALYDRSGSVAGLGQAETMDGGYRGLIRLVPQLPTAEHRKHLGWVVGAAAELDDFFAGLELEPPDEPDPRRAAAWRVAGFRWRGLALRFVRSVAKRTPSAYALGWSVTYNVRGSLLTSAGGVTETMFHEIFHLNDAAHDDWSARVLTPDYDAIVARCLPRLSRSCLARYAPGTTTVKGGTYYAFQQNNGSSVHEYAAELALRYFKEHRELAATGALARPAFKCGAPENARAWKALVDEFFAGVDRTGACK